MTDDPIRPDEGSDSSLRSETSQRRTAKRLAEEYQALDDPVVRNQMALDHWWQAKLDARARARRSEIPETGEYDPMRRFTEEMDYRQEQADRAYARRLRR